MTDEHPAIERFATLLDASRLPTGGVSLESIRAEVAPVLPLLVELPVEERAAGDYGSFQFRECFTVLTLLGRRLALLDLTPTAALEVVELALSSIEGEDDPSTEGFARRARMAAVEGFVRGREERVEQTAGSRASGPIRPLRIDETTFALLISGAHDATVLSGRVDALGREMLDANATIAIVDLSQLGEPSRERARAIFSADEVARMLGATCIFSGVDPRWRAAAAEGRIDLDELQVVPTLARALQMATELRAEATSGANPTWRTLLERLRR